MNLSKYVEKCLKLDKKKNKKIICKNSQSNNRNQNMKKWQIYTSNNTNGIDSIKNILKSIKLPNKNQPKSIKYIKNNQTHIKLKKNEMLQKFKQCNTKKTNNSARIIKTCKTCQIRYTTTKITKWWFEILLIIETN